jgi:hypothetical protein
MAITSSDIPGTEVGIDKSAVFPVPNRPSAPFPQQYMAPLVGTTHM